MFQSRISHVSVTFSTGRLKNTCVYFRLIQTTMAARLTAQDVYRCDLCETPTVHSYCAFCHDNLCKPCVGDHISDGYENHKIVPFMERRSTLIFPKCRTHQHKKCDLQCKNCDILVCSSCLASGHHVGHLFVEGLEVYNKKKEVLENDTKELENLHSLKYENMALDLENQLANLDEGYEKLTTEMSKQGEEWHREINIVITKMKTEICEIKGKHQDILRKHLDEVRQTQSLIKQTLLALREIEKSNEISPVIEYNSKINEFRQVSPKVQVSLPTFIPQPINRGMLYDFFVKSLRLPTDTEENVLALKQPKTSVRELLDEPELVATIETGFENLRNVTCLNEEMIWTSGQTDAIKCFKIKGSLLQTIKTGSDQRPSDIGVDTDGDLVYSDRKKRTINKIKNGQIKKFIALHRWMPCQLCVTSNGDLLVTMYSDDESKSKVVRFSESTEKQTIQFDDEGKPLYSGNNKIKYITENRNHDVCVADSEAGAVVVVNQDGKLRWRYTGYNSTSNKKPFQPFGIAADSQSHILTADGDNHCVHILDQNGKFLRYIGNCDLRDPYGLCVNSQDSLFVCKYFKGTVKKIEYLK